MARRKKNERVVNTQTFINRVNKLYLKYFQKEVKKIANLMKVLVEDEAKEVYIARHYRQMHGLKTLPRDAEINKKLADGVVIKDIYANGDIVDYLVKKGIFQFTIQNIAKPDPPLFGGAQGQAGDLSKWTIGDAIYVPQRKYYNEESHIHPLTRNGNYLDMDHWYDGDPYMERAYMQNKTEITKLLQKASTACILKAVQDARKEYGI